MYHLLITFIVLTLTACGSTPMKPPVINRSPQVTKPAPSQNKPRAATIGEDTRPDAYYVKKGDTLYSIGLEYGYYYKDIAAANNISAPYTIQIGQKLDFSSLNNQTDVPQTTTEDGVTLSPIEEDSVSVSVVTPVLNEPKSTVEPYSKEAMSRTTPPPTTAAKETVPVQSNTETKPPIKEVPYASKVTDVDNINWQKPTQGKITAGFNSTNKGVDIAGKLGQSIHAAATGKVIYSGSDLRGYGKLVIIKHNKTYLSVYAHNNRILVKEGLQVKAGQKIAEMGKTDTNSVKLHYEIRKHGKSVDPAPYLPQN